MPCNVAVAETPPLLSPSIVWYAIAIESIPTRFSLRHPFPPPSPLNAATRSSAPSPPFQAPLLSSLKPTHPLSPSIPASLPHCPPFPTPTLLQPSKVDSRTPSAPPPRYHSTTAPSASSTTTRCTAIRSTSATDGPSSTACLKPSARTRAAWTNSRVDTSTTD